MQDVVPALLFPTSSMIVIESMAEVRLPRCSALSLPMYRLPRDIAVLAIDVWLDSSIFGQRTDP